MIFFITVTWVTSLSFVIATIILSITIHYNNKKTDFNRGDGVLKLRLSRTLKFAYIILFQFSVFISLLILFLSKLLKHDIPLDFGWNVSFIASIFAFILMLFIFFMVSTPNIISFVQFLRIELGRVIIIKEEERAIEIYTDRNKWIIKNADIRIIEFHIKKRFSRFDEELNYIKIIVDNKHLIVSDILVDVNGISVMSSIYKGVKKVEYKNIFNTIK